MVSVCCWPLSLLVMIPIVVLSHGLYWRIPSSRSPVTLTVKMYYGDGFCTVTSIRVVTDNPYAVVALRAKIIWSDLRHVPPLRVGFLRFSKCTVRLYF